MGKVQGYTCLCLCGPEKVIGPLLQEAVLGYQSLPKGSENEFSSSSSVFPQSIAQFVGTGCTKECVLE